jgi:hypothetical protein
MENNLRPIVLIASDVQRFRIAVGLEPLGLRYSLEELPFFRGIVLLKHPGTFSVNCFRPSYDRYASSRMRR